jgi:hypothetical protein
MRNEAAAPGAELWLGRAPGRGQCCPKYADAGDVSDAADAALGAGQSPGAWARSARVAMGAGPGRARRGSVCGAAGGRPREGSRAQAACGAPTAPIPRPVPAPAGPTRTGPAARGPVRGGCGDLQPGGAGRRLGRDSDARRARRVAGTRALGRPEAAAAVSALGPPGRRRGEPLSCSRGCNAIGTSPIEETI